MNASQFTAAIVRLIEDDSAYKEASKRDLCIIEGVLTVVLDAVKAELDTR